MDEGELKMGDIMVGMEALMSGKSDPKLSRIAQEAYAKTKHPTEDELMQTLFLSRIALEMGMKRQVGFAESMSLAGMNTMVSEVIDLRRRVAALELEREMAGDRTQKPKEA